MTTTSPGTEEQAAAVLRRLSSWTPAAQQQAADLLQRTREQTWRPWWCGRYDCDGKAHEGFDWPHARGDQHPPKGGWSTWIALSGRGSGKTRSGSEWTHRMTKRTGFLALVAPTGADARDTLVEGESGLLATASPSNACFYEPSKRRVTWANGARATLFSGEEPDRLRGPQHGAAWVDEACFYANVEAVWDNLLFGLRLGTHPRVYVTTTPKPRTWLKDLLKDPDTVVSTASTYANLENLAPTFRKAVLAKYEGTRLGRQEIHAEVLEDIEGALWTALLIEDDRLAAAPLSLDRIVVGIDPNGSLTGDEVGIVVVGSLGGHAFVLEDLSGHWGPGEWAAKSIDAYERWNASAVVPEINYGGNMVVNTLRTQPGGGSVPIIPVTSRRGKVLRAEPVVALYEQHRVHHVGVLTDLEAQMTGWVPGSDKTSPDRVDALVHALTHLLVKAPPSTLSSPSKTLTAVPGTYRPTGPRRRLIPGAR